MAYAVYSQKWVPNNISLMIFSIPRINKFKHLQKQINIQP